MQEITVVWVVFSVVESTFLTFTGLLNPGPLYNIHQGFTFFTGAAGVHAVGAAVAQRMGDDARSRHHARKVAEMEDIGKQTVANSFVWGP